MYEQINVVFNILNILGIILTMTLFLGSLNNFNQ